MISEGLRFLYWTLFVWIFFTCIVGGATNTRTRGPKKYVINLGLPPEQRWTRVVEDYAKDIKDVIWDFRYVHTFVSTYTVNFQALKNKWTQNKLLKDINLYSRPKTDILMAFE